MLDKQDIQLISTLLDEKFKQNNEELKGEMAKNNKELRGEMAEMGNTLRGEMAEMGNTLRGEMEKMKGEIVEEICSTVNEAFTEMEQRIEQRFDETDKKIELRPTKAEVFGWGDNRIHNLELRADRIDYLHLQELKNLPPQAEIRKTLAEREYSRQ